MSESRDPAFPTEPPPGSDEALSAYLLGELDEAATADFERRLAADPALGARLDALAGALIALAGVNDVAEPEGFADRLRARLEGEGAAGDLDARRERRRRWSAVLTAAAGVVVMAVAGVQVLGGADDMGKRDDMEVAQEESALRDSSGAAGSAGAEMYSDDYANMEADAPMRETTRQDGGDEGSGASAGSMPARAEQAPSGDARSEPVILDEGAALSTDDEARARYMGLPEGEFLRGMARDEAVETAARHADAVRQAGPFASGVRPDTCLDEVRGGLEGRVVARVELVRWQGGETLAYLLGLPGPDSAELDRYELWLVGPEGCDTRRLLTWE